MRKEKLQRLLGVLEQLSPDTDKPQKPAVVPLEVSLETFKKDFAAEVKDTLNAFIAETKKIEQRIESGQENADRKIKDTKELVNSMQQAVAEQAKSAELTVETMRENMSALPQFVKSVNKQIKEMREVIEEINSDDSGVTKEELAELRKLIDKRDREYTERINSFQGSGGANPLIFRYNNNKISDNVQILNVTGAGATLAYSQNGVATLNIPGGATAEETFESVSKNLKSYPYELTYTGDDLTSIVYDLGGGLQIVKTLTYTGENLTEIVLSGDVPSGISTTKTLSYTGDNLTDIIYS